MHLSDLFTTPPRSVREELSGPSGLALKPWCSGLWCGFSGLLPSPALESENGKQQQDALAGLMGFREGTEGDYLAPRKQGPKTYRVLYGLLWPTP